MRREEAESRLVCNGSALGDVAVALALGVLIETLVPEISCKLW